MRHTRADTSPLQLLLFSALAFAAATCPVEADVITDWNLKALPIVTAYSLSAPAYRDMAMVHVAMFDCINVIEPRYQPYKAKFEADPTASKDAAAAVAAGRILSRLHPDSAPKIEPELKQYLAQIPDNTAKSAGIALGEKVAESVWTLRAKDGSDAADGTVPEPLQDAIFPRLR